MSLHTCISSGVWFARWTDAAWKTSASSGWSWIARISSVRQSCRRPDCMVILLPAVTPAGSGGCRRRTVDRPRAVVRAPPASSRARSPAPPPPAAPRRAPDPCRAGTAECAARARPRPCARARARPRAAPRPRRTAARGRCARAASRRRSRARSTADARVPYVCARCVATRAGTPAVRSTSRASCSTAACVGSASPAAPGSGRRRVLDFGSFPWPFRLASSFAVVSTASFAMRRYVVSLPPAIDDDAVGPDEHLVLARDVGRAARRPPR